MVMLVFAMGFYSLLANWEILMPTPPDPASADVVERLQQGDHILWKLETGEYRIAVVHDFVFLKKAVKLVSATEGVMYVDEEKALDSVPPTYSPGFPYAMLRVLNNRYATEKEARAALQSMAGKAKIKDLTDKERALLHDRVILLPGKK